MGETIAEHSHHTHAEGHQTHQHNHSVHSDDRKRGAVGSVLHSIWERRLIILLLLAIFLIAFGIRGHLLRYHYLFEFDAFYHARLVEQLVTVGHIINPDPLVYYQVPGGVAAQPWSLYHLVSQYFYYLVSFGQSYSKDLLMWSIQVNPVIFGSIICILMYFLAKEVFNSKKIGVIAAFVAAVTPAFAYRTMAGAQGDNAFGFFFMILGFIFFVRAVKKHELNKETLINAAIGGIFFGLMSMTWRMYLLIPLIIIAYSIFAVLLIAAKQQDHEQEKNVLTNHSLSFFVKVLISMAIFHVISYAYGEDWVADALGYVAKAAHISTTLVLGLTIVASIAAVIFSVLLMPRLGKQNKTIVMLAVIAALYIGFLVMLYVFITVPDLSDRSSIGSLVGEESVGNHFFGTKYNALVIFPWLAVILLPISLWFFMDKEDSHTGIIFFFWVIITLFMAWYTLKFTFALGLAISLAASIVAYFLLEGINRFNINPKGSGAKIIIAAMLMVCVLGVGASARFFLDYSPFVDDHPEWRAAVAWINANTPQDAKFFNWWDQGHILAFLTDRKYSTDNRNSSGEANKALAEFVVTNDVNRGYNIAAKTIGADYIILDSTMFGDAATFEFYVADKIDSSLSAKYYQGVSRVLNCTVPSDVNASVNCEGNEVPRTQWNSFSDKWKSIPDDFYQGQEPIFYYRTNDQVLVLNQALNNTNLAKVWTHSDDTSKYYTQVYSNNGVKIFKMLK